MTIYFHCGGHKTASTFLKTFLRKNKALFESQQIAVHLDNFRDREVTSEEIIKLAEQDYQNNYQQIIISEDANIIGLMPGVFQNNDRNFFHTNSILKFSNLIDRVNQKYQTKFILCVRRQDAYLESCYKFRKTHGAKYSLERFLNKVLEINVSWYEVVNTVAGYLGKENCIVIPYELLNKSQEKFLSIFLKPILPIEPKEIIIPPPNNQGASKLMMTMIDYLDNCFQDIPKKHRREIISIIKKNEAQKIAENHLFSNNDRNKILLKYAVSNQRLFSEYIAYLPTNYYEVAASTQKTASNNIRNYQLSTTSS